MKMGVGVMIGVVFINQAGTTQDSAFTTEGPMFMLTFSAVMDTIFPMVMVFPGTRVLVVREYRNRYYSIGPYFCAQLACALILNTLYAILLSVPPYFLIGLTPEVDHFLVFFATLITMSWIGVALGLAAGSKCDTVDDAPKIVMPLLMPLMLFSGFLIPYNRIPIFFQWLYYVSFFQYGLTIMTVNQFRDMVFTDCAPLNLTLTKNLTTACEAMAKGPHCFETGKQWLEHREVDVDSTLFNFGILFLYFFLSVCAAFVIFRGAVLKKAHSA